MPERFWTSFPRLLGGGYGNYDPKAQTDGELRQVWVHGDYMGALQPHVLRDGLEIQDILVGNGFCHEAQKSATRPLYPTAELPSSDEEFATLCAPLSEPALWAFHSPLMYWNCSSAAIEADQYSRLHTVNAQTHRASPFNFSLRTPSVFAGKSFTGSRLTAADALVLTFYDSHRCSLKDEWNQRVEALKAKADKRWQVYPTDGRAARSSIYEFKLEPMTLQDDILLALAYTLMAVYVIMSSRKLKAVKSKVGLVIAVFSEVRVACINACGPKLTSYRR